MFRRPVAVLHSMAEIEDCVARLHNCSGLVRCQFLQSASFALFRQHYMSGTPAEAYFDVYKLVHAHGVVGVWKSEAHAVEAAAGDDAEHAEADSSSEDEAGAGSRRKRAGRDPSPPSVAKVPRSRLDFASRLARCPAGASSRARCAAGGAGCRSGSRAARGAAGARAAVCASD